jgi:D-sedoheptulose 7-phosphate isomerase
MEIKELIQKSIEVKQKLISNDSLIATIQKVIEEIILTYKSGGKVLFCGNGGSAADAQHLAAELTGRFYFDRHPLSAEALHCNTSYLTAVANDYSFDEIYSRLIDANGNNGDILIAISTSGNSKNIIKAINKANLLGLTTVGLTGETGGQMKDICKYLINVPSNDTPRIQESHILIGHIICELVENKLFKK